MLSVTFRCIMGLIKPENHDIQHLVTCFSCICAILLAQVSDALNYMASVYIYVFMHGVLYDYTHQMVIFNIYHVTLRTIICTLHFPSSNITVVSCYIS